MRLEIQVTQWPSPSQIIGAERFSASRVEINASLKTGVHGQNEVARSIQHNHFCPSKRKKPKYI